PRAPRQSRPGRTGRARLSRYRKRSTLHRRMRIVVIGAGHVGSTVAEALNEEHELTVVDLDPGRLKGLANRYDVVTREGNGASRRTLSEGGAEEADLLIAGTAGEESN